MTSFATTVIDNEESRWRQTRRVVAPKKNPTTWAVYFVDVGISCSLSGFTRTTTNQHTSFEIQFPLNHIDNKATTSIRTPCQAVLATSIAHPSIPCGCLKRNDRLRRLSTEGKHTTFKFGCIHIDIISDKASNCRKVHNLIC